MANLKFARGTTVPTYSTTGFTDGCLYFNTSNQNIYLRNGTSNSSSTVEVFKGTDTLPQYRVRQSGGNFATINYQMPLSAYIQGVPMAQGDLTTGEIPNAVNWYNLYGQGVVAANVLAHDTENVGFDAIMETIKDVPPLDNARYIVCAVNLWAVGHAIEKVWESSITNLSILPNLPYMCIVTCYRTTESSCCIDAGSDWGTVSTKPMFIGYNSPKFTTYTSDKVRTAEFMMYLCCNGTNDVYASCHLSEVKKKYGEHTECYTNLFAEHSGLNFGIYDTVPNLEKYIYPLYIQY